jgi:hypothetical protein
MKMKKIFRMFNSFEEAEAADIEYWHAQTPEKRLQTVELLRRMRFGYKRSSGKIAKVMRMIDGNTGKIIWEWNGEKIA